VARSLTEQTYLSLRSDILTCRFTPGKRLRIASLCQDLGASLGAVREALSRLASEGLVVSEAQKGFTVSLVSRDDMLDLTEARVDIEVACISRAIQRGGLDWEAEILASLHRLSRLDPFGKRKHILSEDWASAHAKFHMALVASCDSEWLLRMRTVLFEQADRYRRLAAAFVKETRDVVAEHKAIADAVLAHDTSRASALLARHFQKTAADVCGVIDKATRHSALKVDGSAGDAPSQKTTGES
jgi:DNA-binding GntR family transcriptional regulator